VVNAWTKPGSSFTEVETPFKLVNAATGLGDADAPPALGLVLAVLLPELLQAASEPASRPAVASDRTVLLVALDAIRTVFPLEGDPGWVLRRVRPKPASRFDLRTTLPLKGN